MVLTEDQLKRIRDPERDTSVGRIGETPEEAEARQEEAYNRGAERPSGGNLGGGFHETEGPNRPLPDDPAQIAAEREYVERTLNRSNSDLLEKAVDKTAVIDQIRARINEAGDKFASFNVTGRANEIIKELNKAAESKAATDSIINLNLGKNTATQVGFGGLDKGIISITDVTPQYFAQKIQPEIPMFSTTTATTTGKIGTIINSRASMTEPFYNTIAGKSIYSFAKTAPAGLGTFIESGYGIGAASEYFTGFVEGGIPQAKQNIELMRIAYASKYFNTTMPEAAIKGAKAGFFVSLPFAAAISMGSTGVIGLAGKSILAGYYGLGVVETVKNPTAGNIALLSIPIVAAGAARGIGLYRTLKAPINTEIISVKLGSTDLGTAGIAEARTIIGTGKGAKLFSTQAEIGFRPAAEGGTSAINAFTRGMNVKGEYIGQPVTSIAMASTKDVISIKPTSVKNTLMGISMESTRSFQTGETVSEISSKFGGKVKYVFGEFAAQTETARIGSELFNLPKTVEIARSIMKSTSREFYSVEGIIKIGKSGIFKNFKSRYTQLKGGAEVYDIEMPSKDTPIFKSTKSHGMPDYSWMKPPETIKVVAPESKVGHTVASITAISENVARNLYQGTVTPKVSVSVFGGLGTGIKSSSKSDMLSFVGSSNKNLVKQGSYSFTGQGSKLNNMVGSKSGQLLYSGQKPMLKLGQGYGSFNVFGQSSISKQTQKQLSKQATTSMQITKLKTPVTTTLKTPFAVMGSAFATETPRYRKKGKRGKRGRIGGINFFGFPRATLREVNVSDIRFGKSTQPPKTKSIFRAWKRGMGLSVSTKELLRGDRKRKV